MAADTIYKWDNGVDIYQNVWAPQGRGSQATMKQLWTMIRVYGPCESGERPEEVMLKTFWAEDKATVMTAIQAANVIVHQAVVDGQKSKREAIITRVMTQRKELLADYHRNEEIMAMLKTRQKDISTSLVSYVQAALETANLTTEGVWFDGETVRATDKIGVVDANDTPHAKPVYEYNAAPVGTVYGPFVFTRRELGTTPITIKVKKGDKPIKGRTDGPWLATIEQAGYGGMAPLKRTEGGESIRKACMAALKWLLTKRIGPDRAEEAIISYNWPLRLKIPVMEGDDADDEAL